MHLFGGLRKLWIRKAVECCKLSLIECLSRNIEGRSVESNVDYKGIKKLKRFQRERMLEDILVTFQPRMRPLFAFILKTCQKVNERVFD